MRLVAGEYLLATAEVWATWGPRDWGARYCFPREEGGCFICLTYLSCFTCIIPSWWMLYMLNMPFSFSSFTSFSSSWWPDMCNE